MKELFLIDAYAQIFRAYYAIRGGMRSPVTGEPTHAVFGFAGMLLKLLTPREAGKIGGGNFSPTHVLVAVDAKGRTFRDELYAEYKGTRAATPDDLKSQLPRIFQMLDLFGIPRWEQEGFEADDVIASATSAVLADPAAGDVHVRIVSKDKDLEQLLCDRVTLYDIHTDVTLDTTGLWEAKGVRPDQVIDLLTLTGDTSDNVPGVEGIGPKTAAQLLTQYGTIEGIYENLDSLTPKRREALLAAKETYPLSRTLVTLRHDATVGFSLEQAARRPVDVAGLLALFQELGFNRYQEQVRLLAGGDGGPAAVPAAAAAPTDAAPVAVVRGGTAADGDYRAVTTRAELDALCETLAAQPIVSLDTETTGLEHDAALCGISLSWQAGAGVYVPLRSPDPASHLDTATVLERLGPLLEDRRLAKTGHNLKFDTGVLLRNGVRLDGVRFDSQVAAQLLAPAESAKLDALARDFLGYTTIPLSDLLGEGARDATFDQVPLDLATRYAAEDADVALRLRDALLAPLDAAGMRALVEDVEAPLGPVLAGMEAEGIRCDPEELTRQGDLLAGRVAAIKGDVFAAAGFEFDLNSPKQLADALYDRLGFAAGRKTKTGSRSTDSDELDRLAAAEDASDPKTAVPRLILEYRTLQKLISTYLGNLRDAIRPETGRIHSTFHSLMTATGRMASHGPNLQNIPVRGSDGRQIRKAFVAEPGSVLLCLDYSQIELRLLAHLSGDSALQSAFQHGDDIHRAVAAEVFGVRPEDVTREMRDQAKTINFGIVYGVTPFGLARRIPALDVPAAAKLIADYKARYAGIDRFLAECVAKAQADGYVATLLGRRRAIPEISAPTAPKRALGERLAINTVVQGSAADLIKAAMVRIARRVADDRLPIRLLLQIHDELVFEAPADSAERAAAVLRAEMEAALPLDVPLKVECGIGPDWLSAK